MSVAIAAIPIVILMVLLVAIIPAVMGIYIYRDAKRRGMNAPLWTLIGVLGPGFIGLIIYLIVRGEHPDMQCRQCARPVSPAFAVCPYCGSPLKEKCANCGFTLEGGWINCPSCGTEIPEEQRTQPVSSRGGKTLKALLAIVVIVPLALMVLLFGATCLLKASYVSSWSSISELSKESVAADSAIVEWIAECDANGEGVYILSSSDDNSSYNTRFCLLYRNDGYYHINPSISPAGLFTGPEVAFNCVPAEYDNGQDSSLCLLEFYSESDRKSSVKVYDYNKSVDFVLTNVDHITLESLHETLVGGEDANIAVVKVAVGDELTNAYAIDVSMYLDGEIVSGHGSHNGDGNTIAGENYSFNLELDNMPGDISEAYTVVTLYDSEKQQIFQSKELPMGIYSEWILWVHDNGNGITAQELNLSYHPADSGEAIVKVALGDELSRAYEIGVALYEGDEIVSSTGAMNADSSCIAGEDFEISLALNNIDDISQAFVEVTVSDQNSHPLYKTDKLPLEDYLEWVLWIHDDGTGIKCDNFNSDPYRSKQDFAGMSVSGCADLPEVDYVEASLYSGDAIAEISRLEVVRDSEYTFAQYFSFDVSKLEDLSDAGIFVTLFDSEGDPLYVTERFSIDEQSEWLLRITRDEATGGYATKTEN